MWTLVQFFVSVFHGTHDVSQKPIASANNAAPAGRLPTLATILQQLPLNALTCGRNAFELQMVSGHTMVQTPYPAVIQQTEIPFV